MVLGANPTARLSTRLLLAGAISALLSAAPGAAQEAGFRVHPDRNASPNGDTGWTGMARESVTVEADRPFRLRMEIAPGRNDGIHALQVRRNGGDWETLEEHDFPHPQREVKLRFGSQSHGSRPAGWTVRTGAANALTIVDDGSGPLLRAAGGQSGLTATYSAPWPLPEFSFATRFRLPTSSREGFDMVFGYVDARNHGRVRFGPNNIRIIRIVGGRETIVAEHPAVIGRDVWHEAEIQFENGELEVNFNDDSVEFKAPVAGAVTGKLGIAVARSGTVDISEMVVEGVPRTPRASIVTASGNRNGEGRPTCIPVPPRAADAARHGECEWSLVIRRFADGPLVNDTGDRFEFRMIDSAGAARSAIARISLAVPPGHLGGTFVETPGRIGPWQTRNGDLYFIMEPSETDNKFMMMKSSDGGASWREVDGANRPRTNDLESVDSRMTGDSIHIIHQVTRSVRYHVFRTSDHPTHPDTWAWTDEVAARADAIAQTATMAVRPDGSVVTIFLSNRLHYAVRQPAGTWSAPIEIDPEATFINAGPQAVVARDGAVHLAYFSDDGRIWYRRLLSDGTLTARQQLAQGAGTSRAEYGAVLPLAYDAKSDTVFIVYRLADGTLWERTVQGAAAPAKAVMVSQRPTITDAVDSQQPAADLVSDGGTAHVLLVDEDTRSIFSTDRKGDRWSTPVLRVKDIKGSWVRGNVIEKTDGNRAYGYVYDAGSDGGAGMNRYAEISLGAD